MWLSAILSAIHLLALASGVTLLLARERALRAAMDAFSPAAMERVLFYDNLAGLGAIVWMGSGLWRLLGGLEKGTAYYTSSPLFWVKMGLLAAAWAVECFPMITFIRWRVTQGRGGAVEPRHLPWLRRAHFIELGLIVATVFCASLMARGVGRAAPPGAAAAPVQGGAQIYQRHCLPCHQADGRGLGGRVAADLRARQGRSDAELARSIAAGVPGTAMVGFDGRLTREEQRAVLGYLRAAFAP